MTTQEKECICLVALGAAFADGAQFRGRLDQLGLANAAQLVSRGLNLAQLPALIRGA